MQAPLLLGRFRLHYYNYLLMIQAPTLLGRFRLHYYKYLLIMQAPPLLGRFRLHYYKCLLIMQPPPLLGRFRLHYYNKYLLIMQAPPRLFWGEYSVTQFWLLIIVIIKSELFLENYSQHKQNFRPDTWFKFAFCYGSGDFFFPCIL